MANEKRRFNAKPLIVTLVLLLLISAVALVLTVTNPNKSSASEVGEYGFVGKGTEKDPYLISSVDDLCLFRDLVNSGISFSDKYLRQTADLDLTGIESWEPIGKMNSELYFYGNYNGDGYTISNLSVLDPENNSGSGLFGTLGGEVRNLGIESGYIEGYVAGSFAAFCLTDSALVNCYNKATVTGMHSGGFAQNVYNGRIFYCWNLGEVNCETSAPSGITTDIARIKNCYSYKLPLVPDTFAGDIADSRVFTSFDEIDWLDELYAAQYDAELNRESEIKPSERIRFIVKNGDTISFDRSFRPSYIFKKTVERFFASYGVLLILAAVAVVFLIILIIKPAARGAVLTLVLVIGGLKFLNDTFAVKRIDWNMPMEDYYREPADSVDVLLIGSSRMGQNQDSEVLWNEYGISSYTLWGPWQPMWNSYYYLNEALKYGKPKVVAVDVVSSANSIEIDYSIADAQSANTCGMKLSLNKLEAIQASAPQEAWLDILLGFPVYHVRYSDLTRTDFVNYPWNTPELNDKGNHMVRYGVTSVQELNITETDEVSKISKKSEEYLLKIIDRCKEEDIPLVLTASNVLTRESAQPYLNYISELAAEHDVPFINYNLLDEEIGFTVKDFWGDDIHLNTNGGRKQSAYLGKYLKEHYDLFDHRGDPYYSSWDEYAAQHLNLYIPLITDRNDYLKELVRDDRTAVIVKNSVDESTPAYEAFKQDAAACGFDMSFLDLAGNGCWVIEHTGTPAVTSSYILDQGLSLMLDGGEMSFSLDDSAITYADKKIASITDGITCIVYDTNTKQIIDKSLIFDPSKDNVVEAPSTPIDPHMVISHI